MALITINGEAIPTPQVYQVTISDVDSIGERTASGLLVRGRVATKRKISFTYNALTDAQQRFIANKLTDEFFNVVYLDPQTGANATGTFYVGDRQSQAYMYLPSRKVWVNYTFNIIER